jgi:hypothetical protein
MKYPSMIGSYWFLTTFQINSNLIGPSATVKTNIQMSLVKFFYRRKPQYFLSFLHIYIFR